MFVADKLAAGWRHVSTRKILSWRAIPVLIIVRDRVEPLRELVAWLEAEGMQRIFFLDNASSYPPLAEYLRNSTHPTIDLGANYGPFAPWTPQAQRLVGSSPYIVTDPDVIPVEGSHGAVKRFAFLLNRYPQFVKAGFGLKIDDLPEHYALRDEVLHHERQFWVNRVRPGVYAARIDTTFALYRAGTPKCFGPALRTDAPFLARHEPWYTDSASPSDDLRYYREHADTDFASWGTTREDLDSRYIIGPDA